MSVAVITGAGGLIGSEAARHFGALGWDVVGIDNNMREVFFGPSASTEWNRKALETELGAAYQHHSIDVRDYDGIRSIFRTLDGGVDLVVHAAAQPSHDWAANNPLVDFGVNAAGTINLLEAVRTFFPKAAFVFMSTNKVYGDAPNALPLVELETRFEVDSNHKYRHGIDESMSIDASLHSVFGASKVAADVMVQEYGRYFGMNTVCFRGGTLTGPKHAAAELHGFLGYLMKCIMSEAPYTIYGYAGKQVRDAIHSRDVVRAFEAYYRAPSKGAVYNLGGGRESNVSVLEAIAIAEDIVGHPLEVSYTDANRVGDHIWWITDNSRFETDYPSWGIQYDVRDIMEELYDENRTRWSTTAKSAAGGARSG